MARRAPWSTIPSPAAPSGTLDHPSARSGHHPSPPPGSRRHAGQALQTVLALLRADLPDEKSGLPRKAGPAGGQLLPSVLAATGHHANSQPEAAAHTAWLLHRAGIYLRSQGRAAEALPLHRAGTAHPRGRPRARPPRRGRRPQLRGLGAVGIWAGQPRPCPCTSGHCASSEAALGPDHPDVAADLNYVGWALSDLGRAAEALPLHERALRIQEADLRPRPRRCGRRPQPRRLGAVETLGRAAEALPLHQRALRIQEAALGPDHPYVAADLNYVGWALSALGRAAEALPLQERALRIHEAAYGPDHPDVATDLNHVGWALSALGRLRGRCPCQSGHCASARPPTDPTTSHPPIRRGKNPLHESQPLMECVQRQISS